MTITKTNTKVRVRKDALDKNENAPVYVQYTYRSKTKKFNTGVGINPNYLLKGSDDSFISSKDKECKAKNLVVKELKNKIDYLILDFHEKSGTYPTLEYLDALLKSGIKEKQVPESFFDFYEEFLQVKMESAKGCKEYKNFKADIDSFINYPDKKLKPLQIDFGFNTINKEFLEAFAIFLLFQKGNTKFDQENFQIEVDGDFNTMNIKNIKFGNVNNVVLRRIGILFEFLEYVVGCHNIQVNISQLEQFWKIIKKKHKIISYTNKPVTITFHELNCLYSFEVEDENLKKAKDKFVFSCITSLRESDMNQIREYKVSKKTLNLSMQKTQSDISIPLNETAELILKRNDYNLQYVKNSQNYNEHLKSLFEKFFLYYKKEVNPDMELDTYVKRRYGKVTTFEKKKIWEVMSSHKGRASFVTINLENNMPINHIMNFTGHTSYKSIRHYNDIKSRNQNSIGREMELGDNDNEPVPVE